MAEQIQEMALEEIKPYPKNPRRNQRAIKPVAESIKKFGFRQPILVDKDHVIIAGHTRYEAAKKLGLKTAPVIVCADLPPEKVKALRLADNKTNELSKWDNTLLDMELKDLVDIKFDLGDLGFSKIVPERDPDDYRIEKGKLPQYQVTGKCPEIGSLCNVKKTKELIHEINLSNVSDAEKRFLRYAAYRHLLFNYTDIAEYYAHASPEMQLLMEKSALVIIDVNDAIAYGYAKLKSEIQEMADIANNLSGEGDEGDEDEEK